MRRFFILLLGIGMAGAAWGQSAPALSLPTTNSVAAADPQVLAQEDFNHGLQFIQEGKYASAADAFRRATEMRTNYPDAFDNWGIALVQMGKKSVAVDQQLQDYQQAAEKFSKAAEQRPDDKLTQLLWSEVLVLIGDMPVDGRIRLGCYQGAIEKCRRATEIAPTDWEAYNKWGAILSTKLPDFAVSDKARVELYKEAATRFAQAAKNARFSSEIGPLNANWGSALVRAARLAVNVDERLKLLSDAIEKLDRSAHALPRATATYSMWGNALIDRGKLTRLRGDLRDGIDELNTALSLSPKDPTTLYNLARAYVILGNRILAIDTLKSLREVDPQRVLLNDAAHDPDFSDIWKDPEFQEMVNPVGVPGVPAYNPPMRDLPH
jgi:tetratricopeptide (TPR) repeat protein